MTARLTISRARTHARLVVDPAQSAGVQRHLDGLLAGPVAARLGQIADDLPEAEVICLPQIRLRLRLSLAELTQGRTADLWADHIEAAIDTALAQAQGAAAFRFANRASFHAAYLRHRLGLFVARDGVFDGFGPLDLLTPARAMAEMLAADPALWFALAKASPPSALDLLGAVLAQGGEAVAQMVLAACDDARTAAPRDSQAPATPAPASAARSAATLLGLLPALLAQMPAGIGAHWASLPAAAQAMLCALLLPPEPPANPVALARLVTCLTALLHPSGSLAAADLPVALSRLAARSAFWAPQARSLHALILTDATAATRISALFGDLTRLTCTPQTAPPQPAPPQTAPPHTAQPQPQPAQGRARHPSRETRHLSAPFAGVALVLPHLAEDGIARGFGGPDLALALASLVQCDRFPEPQTSTFIAALAGTKAATPPPDRPTDRDLLFIPAARHGAIAAAPAGAPRLAAWAMARFAATLPGLATASLGFLQRQFFHRAGDIWIDTTTLTLRLDPLPLHAVLELAGRLGDDLARLDWLAGQSLTIRCARAEWGAA